VNIAKDVNCPTLPSPMLHSNDEMPSDRLASIFDNEIKTSLTSTQLHQNVYNSKNKVTSNKMFVGAEETLECIKTIKIKSSKRHDRIPQRILVDGIDYSIYRILSINQQFK
jgi:hypothetical protein